MTVFAGHLQKCNKNSYLFAGLQHAKEMDTENIEDSGRDDDKDPKEYMKWKLEMLSLSKMYNLYIKLFKFMPICSTFLQFMSFNA